MTQRVFRTALALLILVSGATHASMLSVEGQVLRPDGYGLAGARVELRPVLRIYEQGLRELEGKGEPEPAGRAATGPDGWFRVPVPAEGAWRLTVTADGFPTMDSGPRMMIGEETIEPVRMGSETAGGSIWQPFRPPAASKPTGSRPVRLEVYDRGKPVPDALIRDSASGVVIGRTGKDGSLLAEAPKTGRWDVRVESRDGRLAPYTIQPVPATVRADARIRRRLLLPPAVALAGRVIDQVTGQPVPGARVWPGDDPGAFQVADGRGAYRLPAWAAKTRIVLNAAAAGHFASHESFLPEEDRGTPPTLVLLPSGSLSGIVVDEDGRPVAQAEVRVFLENADGETARVRTSRLGRFRISPVSGPASFELMAYRPGLAPALLNVTVGQLGATDLRLVLGRGRTARGRVVDEDGAPVPGTRVELIRNPASTLVPSRPFFRTPNDDGLYRATADEDGWFEIAGLPERWADLAVIRQGFLRLTRAGIDLGESGEIADLGTLILHRGHTLAGSVTGPDGRPVGGAEIQLTEASLNERFGIDAPPRTVTGPDGGFVLGGVPDTDSWFLFDVCAPGHVPLRLVRYELPEEPFEIVLPIAGRLSGRVVGSDGEPVDGAAVSVTAGLFGHDRSPCSEPVSHDVVADAEGRFTLERLVPGMFSLAARAEGYRPADPVILQVEPGPGNEEAVLHLRRAAALSGRVLTTAGAPVPGAVVSASSGSALRDVADGEGRYRIDGLEPANVAVVWVRHPVYSRGLTPIDVQPGENVLDLTVAPPQEPRTVRGRVVGPDGEPVEGAWVRNEIGGSSGYTGVDGRFVLEMSRDGLDLVARKTGYSPAHFSDPAASGSTEGLELRLGRETTISGRVLGIEPERLPEVEIVGGVGDLFLLYETGVDGDGAYRIPVLGPGTWEVVASIGDRLAVGRVVIAPGDEDPVVDLVFPAESP